MKLLLDTHIFLWWMEGDRRLREPVIEAISEARNEVLLSSVVIWEIAIKRSLGRLQVSVPTADLTQAAMAEQGFRALDFSPGHALAIEYLPHHHADPFDRALVAQAMAENATLVSVDPAMDAYGVARL